MSVVGQKLKTVPEDYAAFLRKWKLALPRHQRHLGAREKQPQKLLCAHLYALLRV